MHFHYDANQIGVCERQHDGAHLIDLNQSITRWCRAGVHRVSNGFISSGVLSGSIRESALARLARASSVEKTLLKIFKDKD